MYAAPSIQNGKRGSYNSAVPKKSGRSQYQSNLNLPKITKMDQNAQQQNMYSNIGIDKYQSNLEINKYQQNNFL